MIDCRVTTRKGRYRELRWARLLTPLKDNQQPNSLESDGPPTGWNLDHFPAVREDKLSEINSRILENRGKTDGYAVSAVHRDSILRFALFQFPHRWLLAPAPSCLLFSSRDGIRISSDASIRSIRGISFCSTSALPSRENSLNSALRLFYYIYRSRIPWLLLWTARKWTNALSERNRATWVILSRDIDSRKLCTSKIRRWRNSKIYMLDNNEIRDYEYRARYVN